MEAVRMQGVWLLRRHVVATVAFALAAGVVGGLALTAWTSARVSTSALSRFLADADVPTLNLTFCDPELEAPTADDIRATCFSYDPVDELQQLRGLPEVRQAGRVAGRVAVLSGTPTDNDDPTFVTMVRDAGLEGPSGTPVVIAGRLADEEADDEAVINELFGDRHGVEVGDRVTLQFLTSVDLQSGGSSGASGPSVELRIVGLIRTEDDLNAALDYEVKEVLQTPPGVEARAVGAGTAYSAIMLRTTEPRAARQSIERAFEGRVFNNGFNVSADDFVPIDDAYRYEARAAMAVAIVAALAGLVFVGQALSRQVRREWSDLPTLRALGISRRQVALSSIARAAPIGFGAAVVATLTALGLSPLLPVGTARAAVQDRGVQVDGLVMAVGLPVVVVLVIAVGWFPVGRRERSNRRRAAADRQALLGLGVSPPASVGVSLALNGPERGTGLPVGTAVVGVALGALSLVAGVGLVASLDRLLDTPRLYGAAWDLSVTGLAGEEPEGVADEVAALEGVRRAGGLLGTDLVLNGEPTWVLATEPLSADLPPPQLTITRGREPLRPDEISVGSLTLERLGLDLGDEVDVSTTINSGIQERFTIVGEVVVNSTDEGSPGLGALALPDVLRRFDVAARPDIIVVELDDGPAGDAARAAIEERAALPGQGSSVSGPVRQPAVGNVARLRALPYVLATIVAVLAAASLAHALVVSLRRNRRQLAVLKAIGFTRAQVSSAVAWQASTLAAIALAVGIPLGVVLGRWGWRIVADQLGVAGGPVLSPVAIIAVAIAVLLFANLAAAWPGWRAAHVPTAVALRTE